MYILDLLDSMPRLRLSGALMKSILWALRELDVPDVPSLRQLRSTQKALAQKIHISPSRHNSALGNIFYQNSLEALLALVSETLNSFTIQTTPDLTTCRTGPTHWCEKAWCCIRRSLQPSPNPGRQGNGSMKSRLMNLPQCGQTGNGLPIATSTSTRLLAQGTGGIWCQDDGSYTMVKNMLMLTWHPSMIRCAPKLTIMLMTLIIVIKGKVVHIDWGTAGSSACKGVRTELY